MRIFFTVIILFLGLCMQMQAQSKICEINFEGDEVLPQDYWLRYLDVKTGDSISLSQLQNDVQYLKNSPLIYNAELKIDSSQNNCISVTYTIIKSISTYPLLDFGGIKNNIWFQIGAKEFNAFKRGITIAAFYRNTDARHNFYLSADAPFIRGGKWGLSSAVQKRSTVEPIFIDGNSVFYNFDLLGAEISLNRLLTRKLRIGASTQYFEESYGKRNANQELGPTSFKQPKLLTKLELVYRNINFNYFYLSGSRLEITAEKVFSSLSQLQFNLLRFQWLRFFEIGSKGNLAFRLQAGFASNRDSPFAPFVLDSYYNIRGVGNEIERGTASLVLNAEYRRTVLRKKHYAVQGVAFSDLGSWRLPGGEIKELFSDDGLRHFVGLGARVLVLKTINSAIRIDYGIDLYNKNERGFVIGIGQYF